MTEPAVIDASTEAFGHPTQCTEPAPGSVEKTTGHEITVTVNGSTKEIASIDSAEINIPPHAHDYSVLLGCHASQSHSIDPDTGEPSITINGSPIYLVENNVTSDPGSGGNVNIVDNPFETSLDVL